MPLNLTHCRDYLNNFGFQELFIQELGWDHHRSSLSLSVGGREYRLEAVAHKRGMVAYICPFPKGVSLDYPTRCKIETRVAKSVREHLIIYADEPKGLQIWQWVKREQGKPIARREHAYWTTQSGDSLIQKLENLEVTLEEEEAVDLFGVTRKARKAFDVDKVTKKFYDLFKKQHASFLEAIEGIPEEGDREWYASIMLNRLMFTWFVQAKGFLDEDKHYLRNRLQIVQEERGKNRFLSFYRSFLLKLFHDGFGKRKRDAATERLLGRIPFLNGGVFEVHRLEENYGAIDIPDEAFETLFDFFDQYEWRLDNRPARDDREINPDVLGYIFEKYINQKQMGAYYTKEDITEYIGKNTIIPFLFDKTRRAMEKKKMGEAFGEVFGLLKANPDRYIYDALRHGYYVNVDVEEASRLLKTVDEPSRLVGKTRRDAASTGLVETRRDAASTQFSNYFDPTTPVAHLSGNLPHWRQDGTTYFVTFRLADSMPQSKLHQWLEEREQWLKAHPEPHDEETRKEYYRLFPERFQGWLDAGYGSCLLALEEPKRIVENALRHFDGDRYRLGEFVIMPNHVHVLVSPLGDNRLSEILHSWKSFTAHAILNVEEASRLLETSNAKKSSRLLKTRRDAASTKRQVWQKESFDHIVRSPEQLARIKDYIRNNPVEEASRLLKNVDEPPRLVEMRRDAASTGLVDTRRDAASTVRALPPEIAEGLDTKKPNLLERRKAWNKSAPPEYALPTEIWREVVARRQRYEEVREKLLTGKVAEINDLITLNLNIRQFAQDAIENCADPHLLNAFWKAISEITVLDPTCGSGAFLFAALNILEPLYEACFDRMRAFMLEWSEEKKIRHTNYYKSFAAVLARTDEHANERYFIFKSIIIDNLYGVDIMEEAVEICKLRLFLKLAAQVEPDYGKENIGIEPLPDIDFNIRSGNTLVGFATEEQARRAMTEEPAGIKTQIRMLYEEDTSAFRRFEDKARIVAGAFKQFRKQQTELGGAVSAADKRALRNRLEALDEELNQYLAKQYGVDPAKKAAYEKWRSSHQPFHWFVEFYGILIGGGFDAIIGNPPYVVYSKPKVGYVVKEDLFETFESKNLYSYVFDRSVHFVTNYGRLGLIVQLTALSAKKMACLQTLLLERGYLWSPTFPRRPESMFDGVEMPVTIVLSSSSAKGLASTRISRFYTEERPVALNLLRLQQHDLRLAGHRIAKLGTPNAVAILEKVIQCDKVLDQLTSRASTHLLYYQEACRYWLKACQGYPHFKRNGKRMPPPHGRILHMKGDESCAFGACLLNSSLFYWFYSAFSDCEHVNDSLVRSFPVPSQWENIKWSTQWSELANDLEVNSKTKVIQTKQGHRIEYLEMNAAASKAIIDKIDWRLTNLYGFTEEELDFIINYDIKYRMGDALEAE